MLPPPGANRGVPRRRILGSQRRGGPESEPPARAGEGRGHRPSRRSRALSGPGDLRLMGFSTDAIHAGNEPDPTTGAVSVPIYQTSTYVQPELGRHKGYEYARTQNPTRRALEANLAVLEKGAAARCFASGMAAISAVATFAHAGDHVLVSDNTYGGTFRLFNRILSRLGIEFSFIDMRDLALVERSIRKN